MHIFSLSQDTSYRANCQVAHLPLVFKTYFASPLVSCIENCHLPPSSSFCTLALCFQCIFNPSISSSLWVNWRYWKIPFCTVLVSKSPCQGSGLWQLKQWSLLYKAQNSITAKSFIVYTQSWVCRDRLSASRYRASSTWITTEVPKNLKSSKFWDCNSPLVTFFYFHLIYGPNSAYQSP